MSKSCRIGCLFLVFLVFCGCHTLNKEETAQDLSYEIVSEEEVPEEMREVIAEKMAKPFQISFEIDGALYIGQGYGEKAQDGYEIIVDKCQYSQHFVYIHTILNGPKVKAKEKTASYPYIIVKCDQIGKKVIFLNQ